MFQDEEIDYVLAAHGDAPWRAAARCCDVLATRYSKAVDKAVGDLRISYSQAAASFREQAKELRKARGGALPRPVATGIRQSDKDAARQDDDRVEPVVRLGQDDYEGALRRQEAETFSGWNP